MTISDYITKWTYSKEWDYEDEQMNTITIGDFTTIPV